MGTNRKKIITNLFIKLGVLEENLDYHLIRASMVIEFVAIAFLTVTAVFAQTAGECR